MKIKKKIKKRKLGVQAPEKKPAVVVIPEKPKRPVQDSLKPSEEDAVVMFTESAMTKMMFLVMACEKEVGWHGTGRKLGKGLYEIDDVFLYPQEVTSTTIDPDEQEYAQWQVQQVIKDEEKFERLSFHGHSHVNMGTFSSGTDKSLQNDIIEMIQPNDFYIFLIINKNFSCYFKIADREDGVIYETSTVANKPSVMLDTTNGCLSEMVKSYNELVKEKVYYKKPAHNYYGSDYSGDKTQSKQLTTDDIIRELWGYEGGYYGY